MKKLAFLLALVGFIAGLTVHILSAGGVDVNEKFSFVWVLHVGVFLVWVPVMYLLMRDDEFSSLQQAGGMVALNPLTLFGVCFRGTPRWMTILIGCCFIYAVFNIVRFIISGPADAEIRDGQYTLLSKGKIFAIITEERYHYHRANQLRGFSGHWIAFYGAAIGILYPLIFHAKRSD
ncbi:MAG: hypothetical protein ABL876_03675 [Chitinophagaceae bacterium]